MNHERCLSVIYTSSQQHANIFIETFTFQVAGAFVSTRRLPPSPPSDAAHARQNITTFFSPGRAGSRDWECYTFAPPSAPAYATPPLSPPLHSHSSAIVNNPHVQLQAGCRAHAPARWFTDTATSTPQQAVAHPAPSAHNPRLMVTLRHSDCSVHFTSRPRLTEHHAVPDAQAAAIAHPFHAPEENKHAHALFNE